MQAQTRRWSRRTNARVLLACRWVAGPARRSEQQGWEEGKHGGREAQTRGQPGRQRGARLSARGRNQARRPRSDLSNAPIGAVSDWRVVLIEGWGLIHPIRGVVRANAPGRGARVTPQALIDGRWLGCDSMVRSIDDTQSSHPPPQSRRHPTNTPGTGRRGQAEGRASSGRGAAYVAEGRTGDGRALRGDAAAAGAAAPATTAGRPAGVVAAAAVVVVERSGAAAVNRPTTRERGGGAVDQR